LGVVPALSLPDVTYATEKETVIDRRIGSVDTSLFEKYDE